MATRKISDLAEALGVNITPDTDVIIVNDGDVTKKIKVDEFLAAAGTAVSGNLIPVPNEGETTSSFSLGSETSAWKDLYVSDGTIFMQKGDGTRSTFKKEDVDNLKAGKSIATDNQSAVKHPADDSTFVKMKKTVLGRVDHVVSNQTLISLQTSSFALGASTVPLALAGPSISITGSTSNTGSFENSGSFESTGSFEITGSFNVNNLLDLLANFGQTGIPTGSDGGVSAGDINLDGQVNINDLLLLLAGYGNPNQICNNQIIPPNVNHQFVGPIISVCEGNILSIATGSFCSITF